MTINKILLLTGAVTCASISVSAQDATTEGAKGKAIVQVFGNFHSGFGAGRDDRGFELDRSYLGYEHNLGKGLSIKAVMDLGAKTDGYDRVVYIKNARITWETGDWTLNGGLISTTQFNMVEKFWGYRYLYKSFQDQYKFGSSADLGISVAYKPVRWVSLDAIIVNGEGYKNVQFKDGFLYGLGLTFMPVEGLLIRGYVGLNEQPDAKDVINYAAFAGYKHRWFSLGVEYNYMQNSKGEAGNDESGVSVYGTGIINRWAEILMRYDHILSQKGNIVSTEGGTLIAGAQFKLWRYVKIAPNFRLTMPKAGNFPNRYSYSAYLSCNFGL